MAEDCSLSVYMGFTGEDRYGVAFQTGTQIHRINQYAVSSLYNSFLQQVNCTNSSGTQSLSCLAEHWPSQTCAYLLAAKHHKAALGRRL